jgi:hypothetical protein
MTRWPAPLQVFAVDLGVRRNFQSSGEPKYLRPPPSRRGKMITLAVAHYEPSDSDSEAFAWVELSVTGSGLAELREAWTYFVASGLVSPSNPASSLDDFVEAARDLFFNVMPDASWKLSLAAWGEDGQLRLEERLGEHILELDPVLRNRTAIHLEALGPGPEVGLASEAINAAISAGVGSMTVAAGKAAWKKLVALVRRNNGRGEDDWRLPQSYL